MRGRLNRAAGLGPTLGGGLERPNPGRDLPPEPEDKD
jgi:hypothetical protein